MITKGDLHYAVELWLRALDVANEKCAGSKDEKIKLAERCLNIAFKKEAIDHQIDANQIRQETLSSIHSLITGTDTLPGVAEAIGRPGEPLSDKLDKIIEMLDERTAD